VKAQDEENLAGPQWRLQMYIFFAVLGTGVAFAAVFAAMAPERQPLGPGEQQKRRRALPMAASCAETPRSGGTYRQHWSQPSVGTLDIYATPTSGALHLARNYVVEGLVATDRRPGVARLDVSVDGTMVTLTLPEGARVHPGKCTPQGKVFEAEDVVYSLRTFEKYTGKKLVAPGADAIKVLSPRRVRFDLSTKPDDVNTFIGQVPAVPRELAGCDDPNAFQTPVGTGPFRWVAPQHGSAARAERFEPYHGKDKQGEPLPYLRAVEIHAGTDIAKALETARKGRLHSIQVPPDSVDDLLMNPAAELPALKPELRNPNVRLVTEPLSDGKRNLYVVSPRLCGFADDTTGKKRLDVRADRLWLR